eukprot:7547284-Ditylum_brightwellii.AAC.1
MPIPSQQGFDLSAALHCHGRSILIRNGKCQTMIVDVVEAASLLLLGTKERKPNCDAGDGATFEGDDSCKPAE